jgi:hypothetical protein
MFGSILRPVPQPPRPPTPERVDQPFHIVGLFRAAASGILADGGTGSRARLAAYGSAPRSISIAWARSSLPRARCSRFV